MLGILILYFLARWLYNLAKKYDKPHKWLYGLLAVLTYYGIGVTSVLIILFSGALRTGGDIDSLENRMVLTLLALPFGIGGVALLHYLLKRKWSREIKSTDGLLDESIDQI